MTITVNYSKLNTHHHARTLTPEDLGQHEDGWFVEGYVWEDYYKWVNDFIATHPTYGRIEGNFEAEVMAESQEALDHFLKHHPFEE